MHKRIYFIFLSTWILITSVVARDIQLVDKIKLSQDSEIIEKAASLVVTEDDRIVVTDIKAAHLKTFDKSGRLLSTWGRRGPGPNEFLAPFFSDYKDKKLIIMDFGKRKNFILQRRENGGFVVEKEFFCLGRGDDVSLLGESEVMISGYRLDSDAKRFDLYLENYKTGKVNYLLPTEKKYGFDNYKQFKNEDDKTGKFTTLSRIGYCDWVKDHAYYIWQGDLRILKIHPQTKKIQVFGQKTSNYVQPFVTKKMAKSRKERRRRGSGDRKNMSFVCGLFANDDMVGVMYNKAPYNPKEQLRVILQYYTLNGGFMKEEIVPDKPSLLQYFRRNDNTLFSLVTETTEDFDREFFVLKYKISK